MKKIKNIKLPDSYQMGHVFALSAMLTAVAASNGSFGIVAAVGLVSFGILTAIALLAANLD